MVDGPGRGLMKTINLVDERLNKMNLDLPCSFTEMIHPVNLM